MPADISIDIDPATWSAYLRAKSARAAADTDLAHLTELIKKQMGEATIGLVDGDPVATLTHFQTTRLDSKRLHRDWPDIWTSYSTTTPGSRLRPTTPEATS